MNKAKEWAKAEHLKKEEAAKRLSAAEVVLEHGAFEAVKALIPVINRINDQNPTAKRSRGRYNILLENLLKSYHELIQEDIDSQTDA